MANNLVSSLLTKYHIIMYSLYRISLSRHCQFNMERKGVDIMDVYDPICVDISSCGALPSGKTSIQWI